MNPSGPRVLLALVEERAKSSSLYVIKLLISSHICDEIEGTPEDSKKEAISERGAED